MGPIADRLAILLQVAQPLGAYLADVSPVRLRLRSG